MFSIRQFVVSSIYLGAALGQGLSGCTAFSTDGSAAATFQYHRFYDFRQMHDADRTIKPLHGVRSRTIADDTWSDDWVVRDHLKGSPGPWAIPVNFTKKEVFISKSEEPQSDYATYLTLQTSRVSGPIQNAGEITYKEFNVSHASIRVKARVRGASGAVAGIFTYLNDTQEADIEMLTRVPPDYMLYTNQPTELGPPTYKVVEGATLNVSLAGMNYNDWHIHRLDWTAEKTVTYVDDQQTSTSTINVPVADPPSNVFLNNWSAASPFTGVMQIGKAATLEVLWIELLFNTTEPAEESCSQVICSMDAVVRMGF